MGINVVIEKITAVLEQYYSTVVFL